VSNILSKLMAKPSDSIAKSVQMSQDKGITDGLFTALFKTLLSGGVSFIAYEGLAAYLGTFSIFS